MKSPRSPGGQRTHLMLAEELPRRVRGVGEEGLLAVAAVPPGIRYPLRVVRVSATAILRKGSLGVTQPSLWKVARCPAAKAAPASAQATAVLRAEEFVDQHLSPVGDVVDEETDGDAEGRRALELLRGHGPAVLEAEAVVVEPVLAGMSCPYTSSVASIARSPCTWQASCQPAAA